MATTGVLNYEPARQPSGAQRTYGGLTVFAWTKIGLLAVLTIVLFRFNLLRLWLKTNPISGEPNWGHACLVPLVGLYYLYLNREELLKAKVRPSWWGLPILLGGILLFAYGIWPGQNDFLKDAGMVVAIFGLVLQVTGWQVMRVAWFPIVFLFCALPWPALVYTMVASPLQELAASVSVFVLKATGVIAQHLGTKIYIGEGDTRRTLNVAEACAGLRSLMTFITIGGAISFLSNRVMWQRLLITVSAVPIAIFCNVLRVAGQGLLDHYVSHKLSESFAHQFVGMIMLIPAFFLLLLMGWVLDHLFVEEADARRLRAAAAARRTPAEAGLVINVRRGPAEPSPTPTQAPAAPLAAIVEATKRLSTPRPGLARPAAARPGRNGNPPVRTAPSNTPTPVSHTAEEP